MNNSINGNRVTMKRPRASRIRRVLSKVAITKSIGRQKAEIRTKKNQVEAKDEGQVYVRPRLSKAGKQFIFLSFLGRGERKFFSRLLSLSLNLF